MTNTTQKIFNRSAVERMRAALRSGESLGDYFEKTFPVRNEDCFLSAIQIKSAPPVLRVSKGTESDIDNAIMLYEYFGKIDEVSASDPRLWAYLSHVDFREYTMARWVLGDLKDINDEVSKKKAVTSILEHWFTAGNDRDLRRHSIARLWWAAHLTFAPWEKDPGFFKDFQKEDKYFFTRILLSTESVFADTLERSMCRSDRVLIAILDCMNRNQIFIQSREKMRSLLKEINLAYATKRMTLLNAVTLQDLIRRTAEDIEKSSVSVVEQD